MSRRCALPRAVGVNLGHSDGLVYRSWTASRTEDGFRTVHLPAVHRRHIDDYRAAWVAPSHFCEGGGLGLVFSVPKGHRIRRVPSSACIRAVTTTTRQPHMELRWRRMQRATTFSATLRIGVWWAPLIRRRVCAADRAGPTTTLGCPIASYLNYNRIRKRMVLITRAPLGPGI